MRAIYREISVLSIAYLDKNGFLLFNYSSFGMTAGRKRPLDGGDTRLLLLKICLEALSALLGFWLLVNLAYQLFLSIFGFKRNTVDYHKHDPESRFLVLVPAHNEKRVIGDIVRNLQAMEYPKDLYDFYVIADNCTDNTAEIARKAGAKVIETFRSGPDEPTGKPVALKKALEQLKDYQDRYDLMMVFDADNLIDTNMFQEVNSQYLDKGKPDFIQCYLGAKNKAGVIAWFYYTGYTLTNRFFDLAKHRLNTNCVIGGTGFAVTTAYLYERGGWTTKSLTEDFEIQVEATLKGRRILWNHSVRVYDEKPTTLRTSIRQKIRWGQGHWYVTFNNTGRLFKAFFTRQIKFREFFSLLMYMYSIATYIGVILQLLIAVLLALITPGEPIIRFSVAGLVIGVLAFGYTALVLFYVADWIDNKISFKWRTIPMMFISSIANMIVGLFNQIGGLFLWRRQQNWRETKHVLNKETLVRQQEHKENKLHASEDALTKKQAVEQIRVEKDAVNAEVRVG